MKIHEFAGIGRRPPKENEHVSLSVEYNLNNSPFLSDLIQMIMSLCGMSWIYSNTLCINDGIMTSCETFSCQSWNRY